MQALARDLGRGFGFDAPVTCVQGETLDPESGWGEVDRNENDFTLLGTEVGETVNVIAYM